AAGTLRAGSLPLIEVEVDQEKLQGRVDAHGDNFFWLMGQDGRLHGVMNDKVKKYRQVAPQFSVWSASVLRDQLRREFGKSYDVVGTRHYTVCAIGEKKARAYAETLEELYRSFYMYFSVRGFKMNEPEFPLVAVVFPDYGTFARYAQADTVSVSQNLRGYYLNTSNRIALYEDTNGLQSRNELPSDLPERLRLEGGSLSPFTPRLNADFRPRPWKAIE